MKTLLKPLLLCLTAALPLHAQQGGDAPNGMIAELEAKALYHPRAYEAKDIEAFTKAGGKRIDYVTPDGKQTAWLLAPAQGAAAERLWLVCGGNATLGLDMVTLCRRLATKREAWLMVDYPGYGECEGKPSPTGIRANVKGAVLAVLPQLKIEQAKLPSQLSVFGHSLGCAASLLAVQEFHSKSAVLCAPFTSTKDMATEVMGLPATLPLTHVYDNRAGLTELAKNKGKAWILHGKADEVIPVSMSERLAEAFKGTVNLDLIPEATHNDIFTKGEKQLEKAVAAARK